MPKMPPYKIPFDDFEEVAAGIKVRLISALNKFQFCDKSALPPATCLKASCIHISSLKACIRYALCNAVSIKYEMINI